MPTDKNFKRQIRERMSSTGELYTQARTALEDGPPEPEPERGTDIASPLVLIRAHGCELYVTGSDRIDTIGATVIESTSERLVIDAVADRASVAVPDTWPVRVEGASDVELSGLGGGVSVVDGEGDVAGVELRGAITIRTSDGHVRLDGELGDVDVETGDGHVNVRGAASSVSIVTGDGHVNVTGTATMLRVITGDGHVLIDSCSGPAHVRTGDGKTWLSGLRDGDSSLVTGGGEVTVELHPSARLAIEVRAPEVESTVPLIRDGLTFRGVVDDGDQGTLRVEAVDTVTLNLDRRSQ